MQQSRQTKRSSSLTLVSSWQYASKWPCYLSASESQSTNIYECLFAVLSRRDTALSPQALAGLSSLFLIFPQGSYPIIEPGAVPQPPSLMNLSPQVICPRFLLFHSGKYLSFQVLVAILNIQQNVSMDLHFILQHYQLCT